MKIEKLIRPGDKVDIRFLQNQKSAGKEDAKIYKSRVLGVKEDGAIYISLPVEGTKRILLPINVRMDFIFYTMGGPYSAEGQVIERYKSNNMYMMRIELKTQLMKYQRREFYRYKYSKSFDFYIISDLDVKNKSGEAVLVYLSEMNMIFEREQKGYGIDLSAGGIRFCTDQELKMDDKVLFVIHLENENLDKQYNIIGDIISVEETTNAQTGYGRKNEVRAEFEIDDTDVREEIVRFIFEEELKERQRSRWLG